jgi:hypothetical protein
LGILYNVTTLPLPLYEATYACKRQVIDGVTCRLKRSGLLVKDGLIFPIELGFLVYLMPLRRQDIVMAFALLTLSRSDPLSSQHQDLRR